MNKFALIDSAILMAIESRPGIDFNTLRLKREIFNESIRLATSPDKGWRLVDRRLQALRKEGEIEVVRAGRIQGWHKKKPQ